MGKKLVVDQAVTPVYSASNRAATAGRRTAFYATLGFSEEAGTAPTPALPSSPTTLQSVTKAIDSASTLPVDCTPQLAEVKVSTLPLLRPLPTRLRPDMPADMFDYIFDAMCVPKDMVFGFKYYFERFRIGLFTANNFSVGCMEILQKLLWEWRLCMRLVGGT